MSFPFNNGARRFAGLAVLGFGATLALAVPAGASEPGPDYEDVGPEYGHSRYERRHVEPPVVERRVVERTFSERREIVRPAYSRPAYDGPVYGRSAYSAHAYGRPVYARPGGDDEDECRVIVKKRVNNWGDVIIRKTRVCD
jgi:hypothetical protein